MRVRHSSAACDIAFESLDQAIARLPSESVLITDRNVLGCYRERIPRDLRVCVVPAGESSKSVSQWSRLLSELASIPLSRKGTVVALGGGVVGDLAGFVAATYMRGVDLVQVPTSLLAQVDSSVGGKVGIDLPEGKNLVGAFYPARVVSVCHETLDTLPEREVRNGMAEVWKYGFIMDPELIDGLRRRPRDLPAIVERCIDLKRQVVEEDEFETTGRRAILNFGHTVGHAIERLTGYGPVLHGEAISVGMVVEAAIGEAIGLTVAGTCKFVEECLRSDGLPTASVVVRDADMLIETMRRDKKAVRGRLAFSLISSVGQCALVEDVPESAVRGVLNEV